MAMGTMTDAELGKFIKGWASQTAKVIDQQIQNVNLFGGAFPVTMAETEREEVFYFGGQPGRFGVSLDEPSEFTKWDYSRAYCDLIWTKFAYKISDSAVSRAAKNRMATDGTAMALKYFGAVRTYQIGTELLAKAGSSAAASDGYWDSGGDIIADIATAVTTLRRNNGVGPEAKIGVCYPTDVENGLMELDLIHNVQQTVMDYITKVYNINWYPFTPYADKDGNFYIDNKVHTSSDFLTTNAIVFLEGGNTLQSFEYKPAGVLMTETGRDFDSGDKISSKMCTGSLAIPYRNSSTSQRIYKITGVDA